MSAPEGSLTVVIPAYRSERTVEAAVASAFASGAGKVVVVDDGSDDATAERATRAGAVCVRQANAGAARARATGAALVDTEFVVFLDADDELVPEGVQRSVEVLRSDATLAVAAGTVVERGADGTTHRAPIRYRPVDTQSLLVRGHGPWPPGAQVVRTSMLRSAEALEPAALHPRFADDYELLVRLSMVGGVTVRDDPTCIYSIDGGKSVVNAVAAFRAKEAVRERYAGATGIAIERMSEKQIQAAATARVARGHSRSGRRADAARAWTRWFATDPVGAARKVVGRVRRVQGERSDVGRVSAWATGQDDNIGDSLLRRALLQGLPVDAVSVFVGAATPGFVDGLGLPRGTDPSASFGAWFAQALRSALRGRTVVLLNAGEVPVSRRGAVRVAALVPLLLLARARGGGGVWVGAGVPVQRREWIWVYRVAARLCRLTSWRDADTLATMRTGTVVPDLAFQLGTATSEWVAPGERDRLVVTLRHDRPLPDEEWLAWVRRTAGARGLRIVVVSQVSRDQPRSAELAALLGGELVPWIGASHRDDEEQCRAVYRTAELVVSDRLHALVVACTEGAVPLGWVPTSRGKLRRHFDAAGMAWVGAHEGSASSLPTVDGAAVADYRTRTREAVDAARRVLRRQADEVLARVGDRR